jgi:DNA-binding FadR family transcriptional regulator
VAWKSGDDRLHRSIADAAQNSLLLMLHDEVHGYARKLISERMEQALGQNQAPVETSNEQHAAIVSAIRRHEPGRRRGLRAWLQRTKRRSLAVNGNPTDDPTPLHL